MYLHIFRIFYFSCFPGKYPHLVVNASKKKQSSTVKRNGEVVINFGEVPVQTTAEKWIELQNLSPVSCNLFVMTSVYPIKALNLFLSNVLYTARRPNCRNHCYHRSGNVLKRLCILQIKHMPTLHVIELYL